MAEKRSSDSVGETARANETVPSRGVQRSGRRSSCLAGCGCLLVVAIVVGGWAGVSIWQLNRNPDPFPWRPYCQWTLSQIPLRLDFVDRDGSLLVLCGDHVPISDALSIQRCDVKTGTILSSHELPFPVSAFAASPNTDSVLVAGILPSPDQVYVAIGVPDGVTPKSHVLRLTTLRLSDWAVDAEYEEELEATSFAYEFMCSLRVEALPAREAWVVGIGDLKKATYHVSLHDQKTLAKVDSRTLPSGIEPLEPCLSIDPISPSTVRVCTRLSSDSCRWDSWATDSGELTTVEVPGQNDDYDEDWHWLLAISDNVSLSDCYVQRVGPFFTPLGGLGSISPKSMFYAGAVYFPMASTVLPLPVTEGRVHRTNLGIWNLAPRKRIVSGLFQGRANAITVMRFSPDNEFLVTGHQGGDIRLWRLPSGGQ